MKAGTLTPLQEQFIAELLKSPANQADAYRRACVALNRKVPKAVPEIANEMAKKPHVAEELERRRKARAVRLQVKTDDILAELMQMKDVDAADIAPWTERGATLIASDKLTKPQRLMVKKIRIRTQRWTTIDGAQHEETNTEVEMHDTIKIRELIGRHLGLWEGEAKPGGEKYLMLVQQLKIEISSKSNDELRQLAERLVLAKAKP